MSTPSAHATGTDPMAAAAPRSAAIITRRASARSIHAPAGRPTTSQGSQAAAVSSPIQAAPASKTVTATSGTTTAVVIEPSTDTPSPNQSSRKLRLPAIGGAAGTGVGRADAHGWLGKARAKAKTGSRCTPSSGTSRLPQRREHLDHLVGELLQLGGAQPQPVLGRERRVLPLGVGVGVGHPVAHAAPAGGAAPSASASCAAVTAAWSTRSRRLHRVPALDQAPPALAPVAGQLGRLLDQAGRGEHLEVVARVADGLAGARGEHGCRRRAVDLERVHDPRAERVGQGRQGAASRRVRTSGRVMRPR